MDDQDRIERCQLSGELAVLLRTPDRQFVCVFARHPR